MDSKAKNKIKSLSSKPSKKWQQEIEFLVDTRWLDYSSQIARRILALLKSKNLSQVDLAEKLGVKAQRINTIIKGRENLTLETISNLSQALETELISFPKYEYSKIIKKAEPSATEGSFIKIAVPSTMNLAQFLEASKDKSESTVVQSNDNNIAIPEWGMAA